MPFAKAMVVINGTTGPEFDLLRGVRQGCPASPSFFTVALSFISWSFCLAFQGIKLVHLHLSSLEYVNNQILFTSSPSSLQEMLDFLGNNAVPFGLRLAPQKCELICFHHPGTVDKSKLPQIAAGTHILQWKKSVVYLGSRFAEDGSTLSPLSLLCKSVVERLNARVFCRRSVSGSLKGRFISSAVLALLLYGLENCAIGPRDERLIFPASNQARDAASVQPPSFIPGSRAAAWCCASLTLTSRKLD